MTEDENRIVDIVTNIARPYINQTFDIVEALDREGYRIVPAAEIERKDAEIDDLRHAFKQAEGWRVEASEAAHKLHDIVHELRVRLAGVDAGTHQIVPKRENDTMREAAFQQFLTCDRTMDMHAVFGLAYRAMLAAAPAEGEKE